MLRDLRNPMSMFKPKHLFMKIICYLWRGAFPSFYRRRQVSRIYVPEKEELLRYVDDAYYEQTSLQEQLQDEGRK